MIWRLGNRVSAWNLHRVALPVPSQTRQLVVCEMHFAGNSASRWRCGRPVARSGIVAAMGWAGHITPLERLERLKNPMCRCEQVDERI
jgi:hypothetical protein